MLPTDVPSTNSTTSLHDAHMQCIECNTIHPICGLKLVMGNNVTVNASSTIYIQGCEEKKLLQYAVSKTIPHKTALYIYVAVHDLDP